MNPEKWQLKKGMPFNTADLAAAVVGDKIYYFGGYNIASILNYNQCYDPITDEWTQKAPMPTARWGCAAVEMKGLIYVFGGAIKKDNTITLKCERYDPILNLWTTEKDMPNSSIAFQGLMAVSIKDKIFLFGRKQTWMFDGNYIRLRDSPIDITWGNATNIFICGEYRIYVIGGFNWNELNNNQISSENWYYRPLYNDWNRVKNIPISRYGMNRESCILNGEIYICFGRDPNRYYKCIHKYNPLLDLWEQVSDGSTSRDGVAGGVINNKIYIAGGRNNAQFKGHSYGLRTNEELTII
jgi:N-acetylneuraminic acid mutarotase